MRRNLNLNSKKGNSVLEVVIILFVLLVFGIITMVGFKVFGEVNQGIQEDESFGEEGREILDRTQTKYPTVFDNVFIFVFMVLSIGSIIFAFTIETNPLFFILTVILLIILMVVGALIANPFIETSDDIGVSASFPKMDWIFDHILTVIIVLGMFITIALYTRAR